MIRSRAANGLVAAGEWSKATQTRSMGASNGVIDLILKLQIKSPGQQQIVKTSAQQQQNLQLKTGEYHT